MAMQSDADERLRPPTQHSQRWRQSADATPSRHHASLIIVNDTGSHLSRLLSTRLSVSVCVCGRHQQQDFFYSGAASRRLSVCYLSTSQCLTATTTAVISAMDISQQWSTVGDSTYNALPVPAKHLVYDVFSGKLNRTVTG